MFGTCENEACTSYMWPCPIPADHGAVICGPCGNPVTNITDIKPEEGTVLPEWILQMLQTQNSTN